MGGLFYSLGKMAGPHVRKARWVWLSATGTEAEGIQAEYEAGRDLANELRRQVTLDPDPHAAQLLSETGAKLSARVANKLRKFSFETITAGAPNAFALPGGFIFITRSLLELCEWNQDEVAFILGHEMSHVIRGHAINRIMSNSAIALGAKVTPLRGMLGNLLRTAGVKFFESAYSQDRELEADTLGTLLVEAAGYDAQAAARLLSRLAKLNRPASEFDIGTYFSSHPAFDLRIRHAKEVLKQ